MAVNNMASRPIGVFDSGLGGISVLRVLRQQLPHEQFIYYGDGANAPYGGRSLDEIRSLTVQAADRLAAQDIKALVVACNTATSAAIDLLRTRYDFPVIGMEPALKPAAQQPGSRVLVMATQATLRLPKFLTLLEQWGSQVTVLPLPCPGLVEHIERGGPNAPEIRPFLAQLLAPYAGQVDCVVLGCTHYPFVRRQILEQLGDIPVFDGRTGTAKQLTRKLDERGLLQTRGPGGVALQSSKPSCLPLAQLLLEQGSEGRHGA